MAKPTRAFLDRRAESVAHSKHHPEPREPLTLILSPEQEEALVQRVVERLQGSRDDGYLNAADAAAFLDLTPAALYARVGREQVPVGCTNSIRVLATARRSSDLQAKPSLRTPHATPQMITTAKPKAGRSSEDCATQLLSTECPHNLNPGSGPRAPRHASTAGPLSRHDYSPARESVERVSPARTRVESRRSDGQKTGWLDMPPNSPPEAVLALLADIRQNREPPTEPPCTHRSRRIAAFIVGVLLSLLLLGFSVLVWGGFLRIPQFEARPRPQRPAAQGSSYPTPVAAPQTPPASRIRSSPPASPTSTGGTLTGGARRRSAAPASHKQPRPITFRFSAVRGDCWTTIRAGSASGRVLYQGLLRQGQSASVRGHRLWARFGAIGNLDMFLNGRPVAASHTGTVDAIVTTSGLSA